MDLEQKLTLKQQQKLFMSPRMLQSLRVLAMPVQELQAYIQQELILNPALEEIDDAGSDAAPDPLEEIALPDYPQDDYTPGSEPYPEDIDRSKSDYIQSLAADKPDLRQHLTSQLHIAGCENIELGEFIIGNIDDDGYLQMTVQEIASSKKAKPESVENVLSLIQTFDPPGSGARGLGECLLIQMNFLKEKNLLAEKIVCRYLPELKKKQLNKISGLLKVDIEDAVEAVKFISRLNPRPGSGFCKDRAPVVYPDVFISKENNEYVIEINDSRLPGLRISSFYSRLIRGGVPEKTHNFIQNRIKAAGWLIDALKSRKSSIGKISEFILNSQREFFEGGDKFIAPASMKDAARCVGVSESTVSRAVSGKYIQTDNGIYPMKHFFSAKAESNVQDDLSSTAVKQKIASIVKNENPREPFSDGQITELLKKSGINIARRTTAKYREQYNILPSPLRKKY